MAIASKLYLYCYIYFIQSNLTSMTLPILTIYFQNYSVDLLSRGRGILWKCGVIYNRKMTRIGPGLKASSTKIVKFLSRLGNSLFETDLTFISMPHFPNKS